VLPASTEDASLPDARSQDTTQIGKQQSEVIPIKQIVECVYATDTRGYYQRGVKLFDVAREFEGWQSAKEREMRKKTGKLAVPTREEDPYSIAALLAAQNPGFFA
jgi:hypothetical protein